MPSRYILSRLLSLQFLGSVIIPVILITAYLVFFIFLKGSIPTSEEIIARFAALYERFGYEIIFLSAILEALVLINFFVPGLITMAMGAIFARTGHIELTLVILTAALGLLIGYNINFLLGSLGFGKFIRKIGLGWVLNKATAQLNKFGTGGLIVGFAYPGVASFLSLAAGVSNMKFIKFFLLALLSCSFWIPLWGIIIYALGEIVLTIITRYAILVAAIVVAFLLLFRLWKMRLK